MNPIRTALTCVTLLTAACGSPDISKESDPPTRIIVTNNGTGANNGATNNGELSNNGTNNGAATNNGDVEPICTDGEFAVDGECRVLERYVQATVAWSRVIDINGERFGTSATACTMERVADGSPVYVTYDIIAEEGECKAWRSSSASGSPLYRSVPLDAGTVTFRTPSTNVEALPVASENGCATINDEAADLFRPGDLIEISTDGGSDFPAMAASLLVPVAPDVVHSEIVAGGLVTFEWSGTGEQPVTAWISTTDQEGQSVQLSCVTDDDGYFEFPTSLTQHLATQPISTSVNFFRSSYSTQAFEDGALRVGATVFEVLSEHTGN